MQIIGSVDRCDEAFIEGWVLIANSAEKKISIEFVLQDKVVGSCVADQFRSDLAEAGLGDGHCAFSFQTPAFIPKSEIPRIAVRIVGSSVFLAPPKASKSTENSSTVSQFGGLWIDRDDWLDRLTIKHRTGEISEEMSVQIFRFVRDGYLVIEEAVDSDIVDRLNEEIEKVWSIPPAGLLVETFEPDGKLHIVPPNILLREGRTKMLDLFAFSEITRTATAAPRIIEFLTCIFEGQPKAFQGLTFWNGSQQSIHKDTAYVKIDSNPMHIAASWLALEDIQPGTGELEYYIGSHRAPDFLFGGVHKWMEGHVEDHDRFLASLHEDAKSFGHLKGSFHAKKGDVLIWHADLAHGGSPIRPPARTRRSLVTHFTSAADEPFYRRSNQKRSVDVGNCTFVSQFADVV